MATIRRKKPLQTDQAVQQVYQGNQKSGSEENQGWTLEGLNRILTGNLGSESKPIRSKDPSPLSSKSRNENRPSSESVPKTRWVRIEAEPTHTLLGRYLCTEVWPWREGMGPVIHADAELTDPKTGTWYCPNCKTSFELIAATFEV